MRSTLKVKIPEWHYSVFIVKFEDIQHIDLVLDDLSILNNSAFTMFLKDSSIFYTKYHTSWGCSQSYLIHFTPIFHLYTPWKGQKTKGFCDVFRRYHSWNPSPLIKGGRGRTFQKLSQLGGTKIFARKRKMVGWCGNVGLPLFCYFTFQLHLFCVWVKFPLLRIDSSVFWVNHTRFSSKSL